MVGEVTATNALLQSRLTASTGLVEGDVPGAPGVARFEFSTDADFASARTTPWLRAGAERDFIVRTPIGELAPATRYFYRLRFGVDESALKIGPTRSFITLPGPGHEGTVRFVVANCMNYSFFHRGANNDGEGGYDGPDRHLGYPAAEVIERLGPDFFIGAGDNVYYDHPAKGRAETRIELRRKWHEQFVQPRLVSLFAEVPTYWLKDDHDYRINDSDPTGDYAPSHELGIATFREQLPVVDPSDSGATTYRTIRAGRHLQLWFVEGRDHRSPNKSPDGPGKTIWGGEQKAWLQRTLLASDATFKILVSPTPMVGPDDASKNDNHTNPGGFRHEGDAFFAWLRANRVPTNRFFILCGDRHWKYHSVHPAGYAEFSCGALNRENSRRGRSPGDPKSTDPKATVVQPYTDPDPLGGFLEVELAAGEGESPALTFRLRDDAGRQLYQSVVP
ncbi:MAG TPA: alkaline phosphatase [Verrucomicrobiales bacterium]|nr:alkaline phosphatase [Verrucomicrobiales bacterium]